jgi:hypothetical protein
MMSIRDSIRQREPFGDNDGAFRGDPGTSIDLIYESMEGRRACRIATHHPPRIC